MAEKKEPQSPSEKGNAVVEEVKEEGKEVKEERFSEKYATKEEALASVEGRETEIGRLRTEVGELREKKEDKQTEEWEAQQKKFLEEINADAAQNFSPEQVNSIKGMINADLKKERETIANMRAEQIFTDLKREIPELKDEAYEKKVLQHLHEQGYPITAGSIRFAHRIVKYGSAEKEREAIRQEILAEVEEKKVALAGAGGKEEKGAGEEKKEPEEAIEITAMKAHMEKKDVLRNAIKSA